MPRLINSYQAPLIHLDVDADILVPERKLGQMSARVVATRYEWRLLISDRPHRCRNVVHSLDPGGITRRPHQHKVAVHHRIALHAVSFGEKPFLRRLRMDKNHVSVAASAGVERLSSALRDDFHRNAGFRLKDRK